MAPGLLGTPPKIDRPKRKNSIEELVDLEERMEAHATEGRKMLERALFFHYFLFSLFLCCYLVSTLEVSLVNKTSWFGQPALAKTGFGSNLWTFSCSAR